MRNRSTPQNPTEALAPVRELKGHTDKFWCVASLPDVRIVSVSADNKLRIWNPNTGESRELKGHADTVRTVAVTPDGKHVVSGSNDKTLRVWNLETGRALRTLKGHTAQVVAVAVTPDGKLVISGSMDNTLRVWDLETGTAIRMLEGHTESVYAVAVTPDGKWAVSGSWDKTIRVWDLQTGEALRTLEGHTDTVMAVALTPEGRRAVSGSWDKTIRVWDLQTGEALRTLEGHTSVVNAVVATPDRERAMAISASDDRILRAWDLDADSAMVIRTGEPCRALALIPGTSLVVAGSDRLCIWDLSTVLPSRIEKLRCYSNAKAVLLGDSQVGKTGLGLVLNGEPFRATKSTHERNVWLLDSHTGKRDGREQDRELLLWDMAGQAGYRLTHQLHLNDVSVAIVVFDAKSETDPFAGVRYWARALKQAQRRQADSVQPLKTFLVAAKLDTQGIAASKDRIESIQRELGFDGYFATSAQEGWQIEELRSAILKAIVWDKAPTVESSERFQRIKTFLVERKETGRLLARSEELFSDYLMVHSDECEIGDLRAQFETCIDRVETRGLIRRLSWGGYVLLQPEKLDSYASSLVNAAKNEPDGLGSIPEVDAREGRFEMPSEERLKDKDEERLLLLAVIEDMLRYELALREAEDLIFPAQLQQESPDFPNPEGQAVIFSFEGPVQNAYATLAVRLAHSGFFKLKKLWKSAAEYINSAAEECGIYLCEVDEGKADLTLFFGKSAGEATRLQFEEFVEAHLRKHALPDSFGRRRVFHCGSCKAPVGDSIARMRRERGFHELNCPVCDKPVDLRDGFERLQIPAESLVHEMEEAADTKRDQQVGETVAAGKEAVKDFDVFISYNRKDKDFVLDIVRQLREKGILPWLDRDELIPGTPWPMAAQKAIQSVESVAVFFGPHGLGKWQDRERDAAENEQVTRGCRLIPVMLPGLSEDHELPPFMSSLTWADFRSDPDRGLEMLIAGITGERTKGFR